MISRRYVTMRGRPQERRPARPAPLEPLYETERRAMTVETPRERGITTEGDLRGRSDDRPGVRVFVDEER